MVEKKFSEMHMDELIQEEKNLRKNLLEVRFNQATGKQIDTSLKGKAQRNLARVLTFKRMKQI